MTAPAGLGACICRTPTAASFWGMGWHGLAEPVGRRTLRSLVAHLLQPVAAARRLRATHHGARRRARGRRMTKKTPTNRLPKDLGKPTKSQRAAVQDML